MAIASCLVDTNILLRMTRRSDPQHEVVAAALARLAEQARRCLYTSEHSGTVEYDDAPCSAQRIGFVRC